MVYLLCSFPPCYLTSFRSPNGRILLTKLARSIKVWASEVSLNEAMLQKYMLIELLFAKIQEGVCKKTIDRKTSVESIGWFPDEKGSYKPRAHPHFSSAD